MIRLFLLSILVLTVSCNSAQNTVSKKMAAEDYANTINAENLKTDLYTFAGDQMEGRMTGENGNNMAG